MLSLALVGALFMLQTWIAADLARGLRFHSADTAFYEVAFRAGGVGLERLCILATVFASAIANAMAAQAAVSRVLFAMARDRKLPAMLAKVHPRYKTPYMSTLAVSAVSLGAVAYFSTRLDDLARVVNFGALSSFVLLHAAVINHYALRERSRAWLRHVIFPCIGLGVIGYVLREMDHAAKVLGACWIGAGVAYYVALRALGRRALALPD